MNKKKKTQLFKYFQYYKIFIQILQWRWQSYFVPLK